MDASEAGRRLAERHRVLDPPDGVDEARSLLNYAEAPHTGDWTLRSALVRLAQADPARVGSLLRAMRRLDAPLHHVARSLQRRPAGSRQPGPGASHIDVMAEPGGDTAQTVADVRIADVARAVAAGFDERSVVDGYAGVAPLDQEERRAVPLLVLAVEFDGLARELAAWADAGAVDPPLARVEAVTAHVWRRLDELGVPEETMPQRGQRSRG
ncbi:MAG: hypothetical protein AAGA93_28410 [Actinomycetota bacterium]